MKRVPIFLSYAKADVSRAREVYDWIMSNGFDCWMDEKMLRGGQEWQREIDEAIRNCKLFVACLSTRAVDHRGFVQTELKTAIEVLRTIPSGKPFLVPVRLDECEVPKEIGNLHFIDYFEPAGPTRLLGDITFYLAPELPGHQLRDALEQIRTGHPDVALKTLMELKARASDLDPDLRLMVLFDIACAQSLLAEEETDKLPRRRALNAALAAIGEWYKFGSAGAWKRSGRTAENEVYRMGCDSDLLFVLKKRRTKIRRLLGAMSRALPEELPARLMGGGGGGCVPIRERIETAEGLTPIEDLRVGSTLLSCELHSQGNPIQAHVTRIHTSRRTECVVINGAARVTLSQPLFETANRTFRADELRIGDRLLALEGRTVSVVSLETIDGYFEVGTLTTDHPSHNFVYSGLICANKHMMR